jgi:tetratricopeptide (TPR) repeat protein
VSKLSFILPLFAALFLIPVATAEEGKQTERSSHLILDRLNRQADANPTNAAAWRELATFHQETGDFTNAAVCWKYVVELTNNDYDYHHWLDAIERTEDMQSRLQAVSRYIDRSPHNYYRGGSINHTLLQLAEAFCAKSQTNALEAISDILLKDTSPSACHGSMARFFDSLNMPERAFRHLKTGLTNPGEERLRQELLSLMLKYKRHGEIVECLRDAIYPVSIERETLAMCAVAIGAEQWTRIVADGEAPEATVTQQVMAVFMLNGSNLYARSREVLQRAYAKDPKTGIFSLLQANYSQTGDQAAILALYTNHMDRVPNSRKDETFVTGLLFAYIHADPVSGVAFAKQVLGSSEGNSSVAYYAAELLQKAGSHEDALTAYTNLLARGGWNTGNVLTLIAATYEEMGQPAKAAVMAFHGRSRFNRPQESSGCNRMLERLVRAPGIATTLVAWSEAAQHGEPVNCLYADEVDWPAVQELATEFCGDYTKVIALKRKAYEKSSAPEDGRALASLLFKTDSQDEAITIQTRAMQDTPAAVRHIPRLELIHMLVAERLYTRAGALVAEALSETNAPAARKELEGVMVEIEAGVLKEEFVQKSITKADADPSAAAAQRSAAQALRLTGRPVKAALYYRRALAIEDSAATRWDLAYVLTSAKQYREAVREYQNLLAGDISPQGRDSAIKAIAECYDTLGEFENTLKFLADSVNDIRAPYIKSWATARIQTLRVEKR